MCVEATRYLTSVRTPYEGLQPAIRLVDLFAGCGGLSLGVAEAGRRLGLGVDVRLALDVDKDAVAVYRDNFPSACVKQGLVEEFFDGKLGGPPTLSEQRVLASVGSIDIIVGGPPCQGHSDLNNRTRRDDPRNGLYARMARAAEVLRPTMLLVENVPTVQHDVASVLKSTMEALEAADFKVADAVLELDSLGVPQRRRRHVVVATLGTELNPKALLDTLQARPPLHHVRTVRWAIADLVKGSRSDLFDTASTPNKDSIRRINHLFDKGLYDLPNRYRPKCHRSEHSYRSMYGRLSWDEPAQTVTTGFGSMGQGRYVHPSRRRTITPHEAARLQMFPDFFNFTAASSRGALQRMIGNAVPPPLSMTIVALALPAIRGLRSDFARPVLDDQHRSKSPNGTGPRASNLPINSRSRTPAATSDDVRRRMQVTRQRNTNGEQLLCRALDKIGLRYVVDTPPIAGSRSRADVVVQEARVAVYWDGCFWHACPEHGTYPKANADWWRRKFAANRQRDDATDRALRDAGWLALRFWAHEDPAMAATTIAGAVRGRAAR